MKTESILLFDGMKLWRLEFEWNDHGELYGVSLATLNDEVKLMVDLYLNSAWIRFVTMGQIVSFDIDADVTMSKLAEMVNKMTVVATHEEAD